jgi:tetratricopeptide (TPR) repeat protein
MNRSLLACLLVLGLASSAPSAPSLKDARERWLRGNLGEAQTQYQALLADPTTRPAAAVGLSRVQQSDGNYDDALKTIDTALKDLPRDAGLQARRAELLYLRGRWEEAEQAVAAALAVQQDQLAAHWVKAQILRDRGETSQAGVEYRWLVRTYSERLGTKNEITASDDLVIVGLAATANARGKKELADEFKSILKDIYGDAIKAEPGFWPAELQAGLLLQEKFNRPQALEAFTKVLTINPSAAEAFVGKGTDALERYEFTDAERFAEQALRFNVHLPEALRLRADVHLASGDVVKARTELEQARAINDHDERTLARLAACARLEGKSKDADEIAARVATFCKKPAVFWYEQGARLEQRRRYAEAQHCYQEAVKIDPQLGSASNALGLLYMRLGREKEARELLNAGFDADPYNVRVSNTRKVLRVLDTYQTLETAHFILRFDKSDTVLATLMSEELETIHANLSKRFGFSPKDKVLLEIFTSHEMFSGRTVALPDLHTVGACTGSMVALASPNARGIPRPFNWARVIRHEIVHVFNLEQTHFQVPHWLTEGLAVSNEGFPRPPSWNVMLLERVPANRVFNLDTIDLGFIRPRSPYDWQMAYCQANLYVEFLTATYGADKIGPLLDAYRDNLNTAEAIQKACGVSKDEFEKKYRAYLDDQVKKLAGKAPVKKPTFDELKKAYDNDKKNDDAAAALAEALLARGVKSEARSLAEEVVARKPNQPLACLVLAQLADLGGESKKARTLLEQGLDRKAPDTRLLRALGKLYYDAGEFAKAVEIFDLGHLAEPNDPLWLEQLARGYAQTGDKAKQIAALSDLVKTDPDEMEQRRRLARLLNETGRLTEAETYARQALEIDVRDKETRALLLKILRAEKKDAEAEKLSKLFGS